MCILVFVGRHASIVENHYTDLEHCFSNFWCSTFQGTLKSKKHNGAHICPKIKNLDILSSKILIIIYFWGTLAILDWTHSCVPWHPD